MEQPGKWAEGRLRNTLEGPAFSLPLMTSNFRRFNSRVGVVFVVQAFLIRLFSWRSPTHTLSFLALYTFVCLDPYLIASLPLAAAILGLMVPSFLIRHPPPPTRVATGPYSPYGPPTAPPAEVSLPSEMSKDFFGNLRHLQNSMDNFSSLYDVVVSWVAPTTNFSDESVSSAVYLWLCALLGATCTLSSFVPWRLILLASGWLLTSLGHATVRDWVLSARKSYIEPREPQARTWVAGWIEQEFSMDLNPDVNEVEIFELQRRSGAGEWEPWFFSPTPYDPLDADRVSSGEPSGTRFLDDVQPPLGWVWEDRGWRLDLRSEDWVRDRLISAVEIETEAERWVYDLSSQGRSLHHLRTEGSRASIDLDGSPEEGRLGLDDDADYWRRRRWCRRVAPKVTHKRK